MAYDAFIKHPEFESSSMSYDKGILRWAVSQPVNDPIRTLFVDAYPLDCGMIISRSTQHVQGGGWDDDCPSPGTEYGTDDEPSDSNKLWAQDLRNAQAAAKK
jgi:hypothetical protein